MSRARQVSLLALLTVGLLASPSSAPAQKPRAERPTYALGEKWVRSDGLFELVRIDRDLYIFAQGPTRQVHLTRDLGIAHLENGPYYLTIDPPFNLRWPLEVGKFGISDVRWRWDANPSGLPAKLTWSVEAVEEVQVRAGRFQAFRIQLQVEYSASTTHYHQLWYAPDVRQFVKSEWMVSAPAARFEVVSVEQPQPPLAVVLARPVDGAVVAAPDLVVTGAVRGGAGGGEVRATVNGTEVPVVTRPGPEGADLALSAAVRLKEGRNVILITATDRRGAVQQQARTVVFERSPPVGERPTAPRPPAVVGPKAPPAGLTVALSSPEHRSTTAQEAVTLAGMASSGHGVTSVVVTLNGTEVSRLQQPGAPRAVPVNLPLRLRQGTNTLVVTASDAGGGVHQEVRTIEYEPRIPLTITFRYPEDRARVGEESSIVAAVVTSSKGVARATVSVNGVEVHQQTERTPARAVVVSAPVTLRDGANAIVVSGIEADGTVTQEVRTVFLDRPRPAGEAVPVPGTPAPPAERWAVVIGIGRYESQGIPRLSYTLSDAEAMYQTLLAAAGFKKEHVLVLTDRTERKPTLRNIKWALGTFLARSAKRQDTVVIYFAGHGAPEVDQRGVERDGLAKYLIPADADPDDLFSTALAMDDIQTIFGRIEAERVVVFLDACYSGAAGGRTFSSRKTRAGHVDDLFLERLTRSKGRAIITASRPTEVSIELPELGHGLFTYYLVLGLTGAADLNRDGIVSLQELYEYLEQQVTQKSRAVGGNQHPVMKGEMEGSLPLVKVRGR
ncbi:MAG: caspase family protein [Candidatus Rokubacteria bacterium]|nr:caspase family protein [Candidatus Rokubacteria bacterium]